MRIDKTIKGQVFSYYFKFIPRTMTAEVKYWSEDEPVIGKISDDFKYINLPPSFLSPYITDFGQVPVKKLKLTKSMQIDAKELNQAKQ